MQSEDPSSLSQLPTLHKRSLTVPPSHTFPAAPRVGSGTIFKLRAILPVLEEDTSSVDSDGQEQIVYHSHRLDATQLAMELECSKHFHQQDKEFYGKEVGRLRRMLIEAEERLEQQKDLYQDQSAQLEGLLQREEALKAERDELRANNQSLVAKLDAKQKEFANAMSVLEATQKEMAAIAADGSVRSHSCRSTEKSEGESSASSSQASVSETYSSIPAKVVAMRRRLVEDEELFQKAYSAWSSESKHQRKVNQMTIQKLNEELKKSRNHAKRLSVETKRLSVHGDGLKNKLLVSEKVLDSTMRDLRSSQGFPTMHDRISMYDVLQLVDELNEQIVETSSALAGILRPHSDPTQLVDDSLQDEALWVLGEQLIALLSSFPAPWPIDGTPSQGSQRQTLLQTLLQISLTTWSAYSIHSWDLSLDGSVKSSDALFTVYRKLKTVEDPLAVAKWRSLARAQLKFSSKHWTHCLMSTLEGVFAFLRLECTETEDAVTECIQPLLTSVRAVRQALGEFIVSEDLEVAIITPGVAVSPRHMEDAFPNVRQSMELGRARETVIGTCALGLKSTTQSDDKMALETDQLIVLPSVVRKKALLEMLACVR